MRASPGRQRVWTELDKSRQHLERQLARLEDDVSEILVPPYLWLLLLPGINVVSVADLAGKMGPNAHYANANAITGQAGLFPNSLATYMTVSRGVG